MDELADQHGPGVGIGVAGRADPAPVHIELDERGLHQVIRALPVIAQHRGQPPQRRQPGRDVLGVLGVPATAHQGPPDAVTCSTIARGAQRRVRLSRPSGFIRVASSILRLTVGAIFLPFMRPVPVLALAQAGGLPGGPVGRREHGDWVWASQLIGPVPGRSSPRPGSPPRRNHVVGGERR